MKFISLWLALFCILMFILQIAIPNFTDSLILNQNSFSEPYRFISSIFLHGSLTHLIYNLFALLLFGLILEKLIGSKKFIIVFFSSGIIANLISVNFYSSSLGASGAIFGIIGALTIIRPLMAVWAFGIPMPMFIASILWITGDILGIFMPSNIGNIAHLSGIAIGILSGLILRLTSKKQPRSFSYKIKIPDDYLDKWEDRYIRNI